MLNNSKLLKKISHIMKKRELVETTITLRTRYLAKEVKNLCDFNFKVALLALLGAVLTAASTANDNWSIINEYFTTKENTLDFPYVQLLLCFLSLIMILLAFYSFVKQFRVYNPIYFVNQITADQYDAEEHTAIFIIKAMFENVPKILVFKSETWNSFFLPYCHYDPRISKEDAKMKLKLPIAELLEVDFGDFDIYDDFTKNEYVAIKKNPSHKSMSKINYRFFYIKFSNPYLGRKFSNNNLQHFLWKSKHELVKDMNTQLNNGDVIGIIDELSLINQSKLAFQEKNLSSYEISSRYNIIWNITNDCFYDCPICATNSGQGYRCNSSYEDKLNMLLNLSSINGYIAQLDISGGDPLKNKNDRKIIQKANQILAYTDVKVTTTGKALEQLSINEITETVKKCDITYDIPYEICNDDLQKYRNYYYNYYNFRQLEKFSNSGVKVELNIHIPILPITIDEEFISLILDDLHKINPSEIKFIRLMPVGRLDMDQIVADYDPEQFLRIVNDVIKTKNYKFNITYNCSLGTRIKRLNGNNTVKTCGMLTRKLGIDCEGKVYTCIWGAYIKEFQGSNYINNPFYIGDLKENTMYEILTMPSTLKMLKNLENMEAGCRVCAYVKHIKMDQGMSTEMMITSKDPMQDFQECIISNIAETNSN